MTSATDNRTTELLCKLLDERGIKWRSGLKGVTFVGDWCFAEYDNGKLAATSEPVLTPEQAIAATLRNDDDYERKMDALLCRLTNGKWSKSRAYDLDFMEQCINEEFEMLYAKELVDAELGSGTLTADDVLNAVYKHGARWQAIAAWNARYHCGLTDEDYNILLDELGVSERTCHIEERNGDWYCDACGEMVGTCDPASELCIDGNAIRMWNYCPNCRARVVSHEE